MRHLTKRRLRKRKSKKKRSFNRKRKNQTRSRRTRMKGGTLFFTDITADHPLAIPDPRGLPLDITRIYKKPQKGWPISKEEYRDLVIYKFGTNVVFVYSEPDSFRWQQTAIKGVFLVHDFNLANVSDSYIIVPGFKIPFTSININPKIEPTGEIKNLRFRLYSKKIVSQRDPPDFANDRIMNQWLTLFKDLISGRPTARSDVIQTVPYHSGQHNDLAELRLYMDSSAGVPKKLFALSRDEKAGNPDQQAYTAALLEKWRREVNHTN